jgi:hypothetical protein
MSKKKIFVIDKLAAGYNHVSFNAAITSIIAEIYKNDDVFFISESVHAEAVAAKNIYFSNLKYHPYIEAQIPTGYLKALIPFIKKKINDFFFIKDIYNNHTKNADAVFFTCLSSTSLLYAGYKAKKVKMPVFFVIHGEIEFLFITGISIISKIRSKIYKLFLRQLGKTVKILVLSEIVKAKLIEAQNLPANRIIVIGHPIIGICNDKKPISNNKIVFGHIGIALEKKNSTLFFELADSHVAAVQKGHAEFRLIGKIQLGLKVKNFGAVNIISKDNKSLATGEYEENIADIDYAVFTFTEDNYVYRVSGSLIDSIACLKPIIALKHSYFNYLFKTSGNIGFLCDTFEELDTLLTRIINKEKYLLDQYQFQQMNLRKLAETQSLAQIKNKLSVLVSSEA